MSKMADAYIRCEELGIDPDHPDALEMLDHALTPDERQEIFGRRFYVGMPVVVKDRRHSASWEEGIVHRADLDDHGRIRVVLNGHDPSDWVAIEQDALGPVATPGQRYEWNDPYSSRRVPFTVVRRFSDRHNYAGCFAILSDDADADERRVGHSGIASAAELARSALLLPDQATPRPSLAERMRRWVDDGMPRPWPNAENHPVREFADEVEALRASADAMADAAQAVLSATRDPGFEQSHRDTLRAALAAYGEIS